MAAIDASLIKFHISLNASDLERSIAFYRVLFGTEPAKVREDYAKFELAEPPLVLSLIPGGVGGNVNHAGLRVRNNVVVRKVQPARNLADAKRTVHQQTDDAYAIVLAERLKRTQAIVSVKKLHSGLSLRDSLNDRFAHRGEL